MKTRFSWMLLMTPLLALQVACSNKDKKDAVAYCSGHSKECAQKYIELAGGAAASGTAPQVAAAGATVGTAQVPSTTILPASVTQDQIQAKAAQVQAALQALDEDEGGVASPSTTTLKPASVSASVPEAVDVGVARLSDDSKSTEIQPASVESRAPASAADSVDNGSSLTSSGGAAR